MKKKVLKIGNSFGIIVPAHILRALAIPLGATLRLRIKNGQIVFDRRMTDRPEEVKG